MRYFSRAAARTARIRITATTPRGIRIGDSIHHHDQSITGVSLSVMKTMVSRPKKPTPPEPELPLATYIIFPAYVYMLARIRSLDHRRHPYQWCCSPPGTRWATVTEAVRLLTLGLLVVPPRSPVSTSPPSDEPVAGARSIVGFPATPLPFATVMLADPATMLRPVKVSAAV